MWVTSVSAAIFSPGASNETHFYSLNRLCLRHGRRIRRVGELPTTETRVGLDLRIKFGCRGLREEGGRRIGFGGLRAEGECGTELSPPLSRHTIQQSGGGFPG